MCVRSVALLVNAVLAVSVLGLAACVPAHFIRLVSDY